MRLTIIIILSLLLMFGVAVSSYLLYNNHDAELSFDDLMSSESCTVDNGVFYGSFKCDLKGKSISEYDYKIEDNILYLTLYVTAGSEGGMPVDSEGFTKITFDIGQSVDSVLYLADGEEYELINKTE